MSAFIFSCPTLVLLPLSPSELFRLDRRFLCVFVLEVDPVCSTDYCTMIMALLLLDKFGEEVT